jgi:hypothetical protein
MGREPDGNEPELPFMQGLRISWQATAQKGIFEIQMIRLTGIRLDLDFMT